MMEDAESEVSDVWLGSLRPSDFISDPPRLRCGKKALRFVLQLSSQDVGQIRLYQVSQGGPLPVLPVIGAQCCRKVRSYDSMRYEIFRLTLYSRSFLTRAYPTMKKNNPHTPIMLREALDTQPRIFARYGTHGGGL